MSTVGKFNTLYTERSRFEVFPQLQALATLFKETIIKNSLNIMYFSSTSVSSFHLKAFLIESILDFNVIVKFILHSNYSLLEPRGAV